MEKKRTFCADSPYGEENCPYAKVVEEEGEFPVISYRKIISSDGQSECCTMKYNETFRYAVYCTHPEMNYHLVGTVEPYGGECFIPTYCPEVNEDTKTPLLRRIKEALFKR